MADDVPRFLVAAPASGSGKTTVCLGLLGALLHRGCRPAAFKCGPDFIDPLYHREVLGIPGRNLDAFLSPPPIVRGLLRHGAEAAELAVVEGVMGYYDGVGGSDRASSWDIARITATPTVLVVPARGASLSLAAAVRGFVSFRPDSRIAGVILNRCGGGHAERTARMLEAETGIRVYGWLPDLPEAALPHRHLGLATPDAVANLREKICRLAETVEESVDVDGVVALAATAPPLADRLPDVRRPVTAAVRIAVARDAAFRFYYEENLELLQTCGAELVFFSPLRDPALPEAIGGLYLGGGFPELFARTLAENVSMRQSVRAAVASGLPTVAECGGFLYLQQELADSDGTVFPMVGAVAGVSRNAGRLTRFGYITVTADRASLLCAAGETVPAHEFHHWDSTAPGDAFQARRAGRDEAWRCIVAGDTLHAGFPHLYFWSRPDLAQRFVAAAGEFSGGG
ncbi:MAG: cobyrinate a,c-diamide synthase [Planctomycetes bacterium]|nr:cobyrinate a,c-diamide synthase [Planctomycetota bacterium]